MATEEVVIDLGYAELIPITGASRDLTHAGGTATETTNITVTTGWSNTKTVETSASVTAEVSGSYGAASMSVSATVGFGYSDSTSLSKETTVHQAYNFRPGYITTYYQWGIAVGEKQILNGQVKLEAGSTSEMQALKRSTETESSKVKLTLTKIAPPENFNIISAVSGYYLTCHSYGKGNCKMESQTYNEGQILFAEKVDDNLYRFRNKASGYYIHTEQQGRGNVFMGSKQDTTSQLFQVRPTGVKDYFQLASYNQPNHLMQTDGSGTGNVWMYGGDTSFDPKGRIFQFAPTRQSYL